MELLPLMCFCLLTCSGTTFGDEEPPVTKIIVKEDEDVILPCSLDSTNIQAETFDWKKDDQKEVFLYSSGSHYNNGRSGQDPQFKGRVSHFEDQLQSGNASIVIRKTTGTDSGRYSCIFPFLQPTTRSIIELIVGAAPEPYVRPVNQANGGVLLQCEVRDASPKPKVVWKDSAGNILPAEEPEVTENEGRYKINLKTTVTKTDYYRCVSTQEEIHHEVYTEIYVPVLGAAPEPIVTHHPANGGVLLKCEVRRASPKPEVVWKDRPGNNFTAEEHVTEYKGSYNIILNTTVTKTDYYRCVSTQGSHGVYTETHVFVPAPEPVITLHESNEGVLLQCEVRRASPKPKVVWKDNAGKILPAEEPEVNKYKDIYDIILNVTVTKTDYYRCVSTQGSHEVYSEIYVPVPVSGSNTGWIVAFVIALVALVAVVVYFKCIRAELKATNSELDALQKNHQNKEQSSGPAPGPSSDPVQQRLNGNNTSV